MTEKQSRQSNSAIMNQFIFAIGAKNRPKTTEEAICLAKDIKEKWRLNGQTFITQTHEQLLSSCNEAMRLRANGGIEHEILCAMISELAKKPGKKLSENPRFINIIDSLKRSAF